MDYLKPTILAMIIFSIYPIFGNKAGEIHGEKINFIIDTCWMAVITLVLAICNKSDFSRITGTSFLYAQVMALSSVAFLLMLYAWRIAPNKLPVIMVTIGFSTVLNAVICNFFDTRNKLDALEWVGVFTSFCGIVMINWKKIAHAWQ